MDDFSKQNYCHTCHTRFAVLLRKFTDVVVTETSYKLLEVLAFCHRERVQPRLMKITVKKKD